ncbi:ATP-dependent DNA helicase PIF1-like [Parasteatoda tepidariorum]|uniref:ATP-dependent DNA helicase PIF1-like n=1 Tax=Parasteatoda tepidariorum TaxID=114398 RepID=UPI0039BCBA5C
MMPGEERTYISCDSVVTDNEHEQTLYPTEFLNSLSVSGLPPHKLTLKKNAIVLLIRNLNTSKALINGTRMRVKRLHQNCLDCEVLTGASSGQRILIPRINLKSSGTLLPFILNRIQFPMILAFAMTINKSQGQSINKVGIYLPQPVFANGQLYVAASRARLFDSLKFFIADTDEQGHLKNDQRVFTKNIVYKELL